MAVIKADQWVTIKLKSDWEIEYDERGPMVWLGFQRIQDCQIEKESYESTL